MTGLQQAVDDVFARPADLGVSLALVAMVDGAVAAERYGYHPANAFQAGFAVTPDTTLTSWSMAKSITHAAVGLLVLDGWLDPEAPAPVPEWQGTEKEAIRLVDLLEMRSGLHFVEDYVDGSVSNCLEMLYGEAKADMAAYAAGQPLDHPPGTVWNYSSGTTNIVSRIVGDAVGAADGDMERFLRERLFRPLGMTSTTPKFDAAGTFVGSSYVYATARDFARFGELYRNDGLVFGGAAPDGTRILPEGWADHARTVAAHDDESGFDYGRHWWTWPQHPGSVAAHGYEGQYTVVIPDRRLTLVHLGKTPIEVRPQLTDLLDRVIQSVEPAT